MHDSVAICVIDLQALLELPLAVEDGRIEQNWDFSRTGTADGI